jgi:hypothetical protein
MVPFSFGKRAASVNGATGTANGTVPGGPAQLAISTRLRPSRLTRYKARSAASINCFMSSLPVERRQWPKLCTEIGDDPVDNLLANRGMR